MPGCAQKKRPVRSVIVATVGTAHRARAAQARQHDGDRGIGGDDDVGVVRADRARQRARSEQAQQAPGDHAHRRDVLEHPVDDRVGPRQEAQLHAVAVLDDGTQQRAHRGETVDDGDLRRLRGGLDLLRQRARGGRVTLADVGREHEYPLRARGPGVGAFAFARRHRSLRRPPGGGMVQACAHAEVPRRAWLWTQASGARVDTCLPAQRNNERVGSHNPDTWRAHGRPRARRRGRRAGPARAGARRSARSASLGLLGVLTSGPAAARRRCGRTPRQFVPARARRLAGLARGAARRASASGLSKDGFQTLMLVMCASYALVLASARALPLRALAARDRGRARDPRCSGPPLISQDVFGYLGFARLGALHGLDPYTHTSAQAATDAVYPFLGWPSSTPPYGPLFTLASYAIAPLGLAGGLWALQSALRGAASLGGGRARRARGAAGWGHRAAWAAAFVGLNPVLLVLAVGGGAQRHARCCSRSPLALVLSRRRRPRARARGGERRSWRAWASR